MEESTKNDKQVICPACGQICYSDFDLIQHIKVERIKEMDKSYYPHWPELTMKKMHQLRIEVHPPQPASDYDDAHHSPVNIRLTP